MVETPDLFNKVIYMQKYYFKIRVLFLFNTHTFVLDWYYSTVSNVHLYKGTISTIEKENISRKKHSLIPNGTVSELKYFFSSLIAIIGSPGRDRNKKCHATNVYTERHF